jgi:hypothetical protein
VKERIVGAVAGATLFEDRKREIEGEPLGDTEVELVGVF